MRILPGHRKEPLAPVSPAVSFASAGVTLVAGLLAARFLSSVWQLFGAFVLTFVLAYVRDWFGARTARDLGIQEPVEIKVPNGLWLGLCLPGFAIAFGVGYLSSAPWLDEPAAFLGISGAWSILVSDSLRRKYWETSQQRSSA